MKKQLEGHSNKLVDMIEDLETKIYELDEKIDAINDRASNRASGELTDKEQDRVDMLEEQKSNLEEAKDYLEQAQDKLQDAMQD
jgi:peptidoglycan hydrolase CwlO-like protein